MRLKYLILLLLPALALSAKVKEVAGSYRYYVPRHIAVDQAEQIALERAMIEAVAREFGTIVSLDTHLDMRSSKSGEREDFYSSASSLVKGEWIETIGKPQFSLALDGGELVVTCEVRGRARDIDRAQAQLDVRILANATTDDAETSTFISGDKCFLAFTSPVSGYLTVYLEGEDKTVFRMLPFYDQRETSQRILQDTRYVFFASTEGDSEQYRLTAAPGQSERNVIYVIFSPNEYIKPVDRSDGSELSLRQLSTDDFRRWLSKARALDPALQIIPRPITITSPVE